jgi:hypothetical protein
VGDYTINFTTAMPDANYAGSGMSGTLATTTNTFTTGPVSITTTAYRFLVKVFDNNLGDREVISMIFVR